MDRILSFFKSTFEILLLKAFIHELSSNTIIIRILVLPEKLREIFCNT